MACLLMLSTICGSRSHIDAIVPHRSCADSYRLCKNVPGAVSEECFQRTTLDFVGSTSTLLHINGSSIEIPMVKVNKGTYPEGSQWARMPFPECAGASLAYHMCVRVRVYGSLRGAR